ncbi:MAG: phospholipase D family protein [Polyangiaceae bacterium]|nr:phospholipase D family protein [Polyangiaceae bacterium]
MKSLVFTGSHNLTTTSLRSNDEAIVRVDDAATFAAYAANFAALK